MARETILEAESGAPEAMHEPSHSSTRKDGVIRRPTYWIEDLNWNSSNDPVIVDWERVRRQIEHEDTLINHRITWLLQTTAMLLVTFGAGVYFIRKEGPGQDDVSTGLLLLVLIVFGLLVSFITLRSVKMANAQIECLVTWWNHRIEEENDRINEEHEKPHPRLVGGPGSKVDRFLRWGYFIPTAFFVLWFGIGFAAFYNLLTKLVSDITRDWIYGVIICSLVVIIIYPKIKRRSSATSRNSP